MLVLHPLEGEVVPNSASKDWTRLSDEGIIDVCWVNNLDAAALKRADLTLPKERLRDAVSLALAALKSEPTRPNHKKRKSRSPASAMESKDWDPNKLSMGLSYRVDWASLVRLIDCAPINTVIDAFLLIPKREIANENINMLAGQKRFIQRRDIRKKPYPHALQRSSPTPQTKRLWLKRRDERIESYKEELERWNALSPNEKLGYIYPEKENPKECVADDHTTAIRAVLHKCIEERLWDVICGYDVTKSDPYASPTHTPMDNEQVLHTVKRMFGKDVKVHNGPSSFFYTPYGWLGFTPFLLAAERQNLPLVKYLRETYPPSITAESKSQAGNNAYALSEAYLLWQLRRTPEEMEGSEMLAYLRPIVDEIRLKRDEYDAWCGE